MIAPRELATIGCRALPVCGEPARRRRLRESDRLNGIDYVEVGDDGVTLCVHLFGEIPGEIGVANVRIHGGHRITGLRVTRVRVEHEPETHDDPCLRVEIDRPGDHTPYCLCLVDAAASRADPASWHAYPGFDPRYACAEVRFRLDCQQGVDCAGEASCIEPARTTPQIDYLAKDYASFRRLFLDRMALTMPEWRERHVPDVAMAVVETLAYTADYLSYYQDAVATEAYLGTARRRVSVRRHVRLVDYHLHEGCNARALVTIASDTDLDLPLGDVRLLVPAPGETNPVPGVIDEARLRSARESGAVVFEPMSLDGATTLRVVAAHSAIRIYTWGDEACCLPRGSTRATLVDAADPVPPSAPDGPESTESGPHATPVQNMPLTHVPSDPVSGASPEPDVPKGASDRAPEARPRVLDLKAGDLLIFEEVLGTRTGDPADADPAHGHAVRLTAVEPAIDPLTGTPVLEVAWDPCDALPFDLCLSVRRPAPDCTWLHDVSLARGNVILVDHGDHVPGSCDCDGIVAATADDSVYPGLAAALAAIPNAGQRCKDLGEDCWLVPGSIERGCCRCEGAVHDVTRPPAHTGHCLPVSPLTWTEPLPPGAPVCRLLERDPRRARPQVEVYGGPLGDVLTVGAPSPRWRWEPRHDLLESAGDDRHFVVEVDDDGIAHLRFGDGTLGRAPEAGEFFRARPRIGNGPDGNVGRDTIVWISLGSNTVSGANLQPRNPLAASGGTAPERVAEAKLYAPGAFRARPLRAVVAEDYAAFAGRDRDVQGAGCAMEWTGSWMEANVVLDPLGTEDLSRPVATRVAADLERYRRIGHDVAVEGACYVPLVIVLHVCVKPEFLVAHVEAELHDRFGSGLRRDGTPAFFHPDRLEMGRAVYASALMAEAQVVPGVAHVEVTMLVRLEDAQGSGVPADGMLEIAGREIARVDNDPDYPDRGRITFTMEGGR